MEATSCQGSPYSIGNQIYTVEGTYTDTVIFAGGCLEILETTLSFVDSLRIEIDIIKLASGFGVSDGNAAVAVRGGSGVHDIVWTDGTGIPVGKDLTGGTEYCIAVMDSIGCTLDTCFEMPFVTPIRATLENDTLDCFGDNDGTLVLNITRGHPPYDYVLVNLDNGLSVKQGTIIDTTGTVFFLNLVAGNYEININTTTVTFDRKTKVVAPEAINISIDNQTPSSCHNTCDAMVDFCLLYTSPSPRDGLLSRMPSSA